MTQNGSIRYNSTLNDEVRQSVTADYHDAPEELLGSKMEKESYLDLLTWEMLDSTGIPQSRN